MTTNAFLCYDVYIMTYKNNDRVIIHSLGPMYEGLEFKGTVKGLACNDIYLTIYIVQLDNPLELNWGYECITVPNGCLRPL